jgi:DNA repair exonuclease SbcCD ATPase subunit
MSHATKKPAGPLVQAAEALEDELRRLGSIAREAQRLPLDSQRNLERTREKLAELGAVDERLRPLVAALMSAVKELVDDQQAQAVALGARTEEVRRRAEAFQALMLRYAELGRSFHELNELVQAFASGGKATPAAPAAEPPSLGTVQESMARLADTATEVAQAARTDGFEDVARQADSLRQQLLSARNKLNLVAERHDRARAVH